MDQLPGFPNVAVRSFQSEADYRAIAGLYLLSMERDNTDPASLLSRPQTAAEIAELAQWLGQPRACLILAEAEGSVIGFVVIGERMDQRGRWSYLHRGLVHPAWRGRGLGTALLQEAECQLQQLAATHPTNGQALFAAEAGASVESAALLQKAGYQDVWCLAEYSRESSTPPAIAAPAGIEISPAQPGDHLELWRADDEIFGGTGEWDRHISPHFEPSAWLVARAHGEIVGFCQIEQDAPNGVVCVLGVRPTWRRRGIGRALLVAAIQMLTERGAVRVRTTATIAGETPINNLYTGMGFQVLRTHSWYQKPIANDRFTFQWPAAEQFDIGERRLHMVRAGTGKPTVVFDAGGLAACVPACRSIRSGGCL
jgi:mycothiol synthase